MLLDPGPSSELRALCSELWAELWALSSEPQDLRGGLMMDQLRDLLLVNTVGGGGVCLVLNPGPSSGLRALCSGP